MAPARRHLRRHHRRTPTGRDPVPRTRYRAIPPPIEAVNPIGSGDSLLAGLVDGWLERLEPEALLRHALGCAVANAMVWDAGAIDPAEVARWAERIEIEPMGRVAPGRWPWWSMLPRGSPSGFFFGASAGFFGSFSAFRTWMSSRHLLEQIPRLARRSPRRGTGSRCRAAAPALVLTLRVSGAL